MAVQTLEAPDSVVATERPQRGYCDDLNLEAIDEAIDRGDLDTVREHLGLSRTAWTWLLRNL